MRAPFMIAMVFTLAGATGQTWSDDTPFHAWTEAQLDAYFHRQAAAQTPFEARLTDVVVRSVGTPYADGPLGEGPDGKYDTDPLVDFTRADCVTYVEQTVASAAAKSYADMFDRLQRIRYHDGIIDYEARNHFFITDWIAHNPFCIDVTADLGVPTDTATRTISRRDFFHRVNAPGLGEATPDQAVTLRYVRANAAEAAEKALPSPALVVFIGKVDWLFALHCGLFVRDETGAGKLYHASSKAGEVAATDLSDYVADQAGRYVGFTAYRIEAPK